MLKKFDYDPKIREISLQSKTLNSETKNDNTKGRTFLWGKQQPALRQPGTPAQRRLQAEARRQAGAEAAADEAPARQQRWAEGTETRGHDVGEGERTARHGRRRQR